MPSLDLAVPVAHRGVLLGAVSVRMPRGEALRPAGRQLVADVASQAGLVLANAGLVEDLRASRQRLVTAQDEARRQLERDVHDGAQQDLVALAIRLRLAESEADNDSARELLRELQANAAGALANLRDLARGIYPPLLADHGLAAALRAQTDRSPVPVAIEADGIGRFGQDAEAAAYFCCLEALQNTAKYAGASAARICLEAGDGILRFTVSDDGIGYDARTTPLGSGLRNMADRLAALGGRLEVTSEPGKGTAIIGYLPSATLNRTRTGHPGQSHCPPGASIPVHAEVSASMPEARGRPRASSRALACLRESVVVGPDRAEFELAAVSLRVPRGDRDGLIEVLALEDVETGNPLFRLAEWPVAHKHLPMTDPHRDGFADRAQGVSGDALAPAFDIGQPLLDSQVVLGGFSLGGRGWVRNDEHHVLHGFALLGWAALQRSDDRTIALWTDGALAGQPADSRVL